MNGKGKGTRNEHRTLSDQEESRSIILAMPKGIKVSPVGIEITRNLSFDDWLHLGDMLKIAEGAVQFWIGDYLNYGESKYGEKYAQAVDEKQADTWRHYAWVAASVEMCLRKHILTYKHHEAVAPLSPAEQKDWLAKAAEQGWSVHDLRAEIRHAKPSPPLPEGKYRVISADPPWQYADELIEGYGAATHHYPTMSIEELCALGVKDLVPDNAVLFLWTTAAMLDETFKVVEAWGFTSKASFVWDKIRHNFGHYNSVRHEFLLVCTRGSCLPDSDKLADSVIQLERTEVHSEKPTYFRELIDQMYTPPQGRVDRIELFARGKVPKHWHSWGNEPPPAELPQAGSQVEDRIDMAALRQVQAVEGRERKQIGALLSRARA